MDELTDTLDFHNQSPVEQVQALINRSAEVFGISSESLPDQKADKQWGGYITLNSTEHGAEKLLFVRPIPPDIPSTWDWSGDYAETIERLTGRKGVALSLQRHTDDRTEAWRVVTGRGHYLTSESSENPLNHLRSTRLGNEGELAVEHDGYTWHAVVNSSPDEFLIIHEIIESKGTFREEEIERHSDLFHRDGSNKNI